MIFSKDITILNATDLENEQMAFSRPDGVDTNMILEQLYRNTDKATALSFIFDVVEGSFKEQNLDLVNEILLLLKPAKCDIIISTGILRCCSRAKKLLTNFELAKENVKNFIDSENLNSSYLLRGL